MKPEMIRSGEMEFRPRARLLKLLGGELIRDEVMAVVELVKNAHDADASFARLEMNDASSGSGEIRIIDDGCGMTFDQLRDHWMQPAGSSKRNGSRYTSSGRRMLGEKGVGRFASDRLGQHLELRTRSHITGEEVVAEFDWDRFDDDRKMLSEVRSRWRVEKMKSGTSSGTEIIIRGLRDSWNQRKFRKVSTRLQRLLNPLHQLEGFSIEVESNEFPDYSGVLRQQIINESPYKISIRYDGNGCVHVASKGMKEESIPWNGNPLMCGPVRVILRAFDLETNALARLGNPVEVRAWLRQWSGVSVYRDGFRVLPYGEPDDDWLRLDRRRVNNPVSHISNNQVIGFVEISNDENPGLRDQTNRGGIIHGREFDDLKRLVLFTFQMVEGERQVLRRDLADRANQLDSGETEENSFSTLLDELSVIAKEAGGRFGSKVKKITSVLREREKIRVAANERVLKDYRGLAAQGMLMRSTNLVTRAQAQEISRCVEELDPMKSGQGNNEDKSLLRHLTWLLREFNGHVSYLEALDPEGGRTSRFLDLSRELKTFDERIRPLKVEMGAIVRLHYPKNEVIRIGVPPATLHHVLLILLRNTLDWATPGNPASFTIRFRQDESERSSLIVSDNGPGIPHRLWQQVFEPGFSTRENGAGMGLSIARDLLHECGADITLRPARGLAGLVIKILLPDRRN